jgi:gentisate 1,2-dioxygenase
LLTTFFVIEGKGAYSLLLGRDWIHANCCIPSTMHQQLVQWVDDDIEVVQADDSVSVANVEPTSGNIKASIDSQEKTGVQVLLNLSAVINSRFKQSALIVIFNGQSC